MGRGRPPRFAPEKQLIIELRRLTACSIDRLLIELSRAGYQRHLPRKTQAGVWAPSRRVVATRPLARLDCDEVSTVVVHVVPVCGGAVDEGELALFWEPVSRTLFFDTARTFAGSKLLSFVAASLRRLPVTLQDRIKLVQFTHPYGEGAFWYEEDVELIDPLAWPRAGERPRFKRQDITYQYGPLEFSTLLDEGEHASVYECVRRWVDEYNVGRRPLRYTQAHQLMPEQWQADLEYAGPLARLHELMGRKKSPSALAGTLRTKVKPPAR